MTIAAALSIARQYVVRLRQKGIPVAQAILFGSQVRGTAHAWSDVDICIVSPTFGKDRQKERLELMRWVDSETERIEPHPYRSEGLDNKYDSLANEIRKTGIVVH